MNIQRDDFLRVTVLWEKFHYMPRRQGSLLCEGEVLRGVVTTACRDNHGVLFMLACDDGRTLILHEGEGSVKIERLVFEGWRSHYARVDERTIHHGE